MKDPRTRKLAEILVNYSTGIRKNDRVLLKLWDEGIPLLKEVYRLCLKKGALVRITMRDSELDPVFYRHANKAQLTDFPKLDMAEVKWATSLIAIHGDRNTKCLSNADSKKMAMRSAATHRIRDHVVKNLRWVICNYPSQGLAQDAEMSLDEYADFVYGATNIDWARMSKKQDGLKRVLDRGKRVRILGKNTDLSFSIRGRKAIKCDGHRNMPDGEVFMAPDEFSVEGHVEFEFPAVYRGNEVEGVALDFEKGLCVKATAEKNQKYLNAMLSTDKGSRRLGEFGVGLNMGIQKFTRDILFDEKIGGTIHLALGMAYQEGGGKNRSALHWDMIKDLRKDGEIQVDGRVIQRNGKFKI